jgi:hypothetical protein
MVAPFLLNAITRTRASQKGTLMLARGTQPLLILILVDIALGMHALVSAQPAAGAEADNAEVQSRAPASAH